ncbi:MAG: hypothetical protein ABIF12_01760 [bacterium]
MPYENNYDSSYDSSYDYTVYDIGFVFNTDDEEEITEPYNS